MNMAMRPIETRYAGCRFRSRLEARWAVFFDQLGIEWQYEPQGFETPRGRYLPDFFIPIAGYRGDWPGAWIEIRPTPPSESQDWDREIDFAEMMRHRYYVLAGNIPQSVPWVLSWWPASTAGHAQIPAWVREAGEWDDDLGALSLPCSLENLRAALTRARSARFEHGERP